MIRINFHKTLRSGKNTFSLQMKGEVNTGNIIGIYGPSGAGKTSLLRMLSGLLLPDSGSLSVDNVTWYDSQEKKFLPSEKRNVGFVFQDYALFPHMTVRKNLEYALPKNGNKLFLEEVLELMELTGWQHRKPETLSGGQQQRVAIARALVQHPQLLLLDEPLSAVDDDLREQLRHYLLKIQGQLKLTIFLVSHNKRDLQVMADELLYVEEGKIFPKIIESRENKMETGKKSLLTGTLKEIQPAEKQITVTLSSEDWETFLQIHNQPNSGNPIQIAISPSDKNPSKT